ncbi:hypothetical protein [Nocardioides aurantiacus]|uniref:Glycosyltransferase involved in cell wall biosynthesis n=1 Tax=Nocardioides aurantiacus TaxID=86796 RepID=A0A3N2CZP3_9ACTN|nr:hypothetical protein [Nocardioides aurantiacus]ROR93007.1 hypothetical protein EDD33_3912 [Nocardioides aurantiacus]
MPTPSETSGDVPVHVVPGPRGHGVDLCARQLADAVGATVVAEVPPGDARPLHLHVTDRVWGATPEAAATAVVAVCRSRPTTLTLHDVPQPHDGRALFPRRRAAYAAMARAAAGVVVSSRHERGLLARVLEDHPGPRTPVGVVPLPAVARPDRTGHPDHPGHPDGGSWHRPGRSTLGVAGWVYPGKGHLQALGAAAALARRGLVVDVLALGAVARGHDADAEELVRRGARIGVEVRISGWLADHELDAALAAVDVPYAGHRNVSASGSVNSWLSAGRRPLVRRGPYFEEMARLRPGTLHLVDVAGLPDAVAAALADPSSTRLRPGAGLAHDLADAARGYERFWQRVLLQGTGRVA